MSPQDPDAYFSWPKLNTPKYDEVHISVAFTWDIQKAKELAIQWRRYGLVKLGGPAFDDQGGVFQSGMYLKKGVTITSRGCPNNCSFCFAHKREGKIRELPITEGNIIQDNNILACSNKHWRLVIDMLKKQKAVSFKGGLEKYRITPKIVEDLRGLRIRELWLACDQASSIKPLEKAVELLSKAGFTRNHLYCYVLIGDNARENIHRLKYVKNRISYWV